MQQHLRHNATTHLEALNLALDICAALTICRQSGYLYINLKPGNIYITPEQGYKIGDVGLVNLASLTPATCIGLGETKGSIEVGKDADIAIVDADINVQKTILGGRTIYEI